MFRALFEFFAFFALLGFFGILFIWILLANLPINWTAVKKEVVEEVFKPSTKQKPTLHKTAPWNK